MVLFDSKSQNTLYVTKRVVLFFARKKIVWSVNLCNNPLQERVYFSSYFINFLRGKNKRKSTVFDKEQSFFFTRLYSNETFCFLNVLAEANVVFDLKSKNTLYVTKKEVYFSSCFTNFFGGKNKRESTVFDKEQTSAGGRGGAASRLPSLINSDLIRLDLFFSFTSENQRLSTPWS